MITNIRSTKIECWETLLLPILSGQFDLSHGEQWAPTAPSLLIDRGSLPPSHLWPLVTACQQPLWPSSFFTNGQEWQSRVKNDLWPLVTTCLQPLWPPLLFYQTTRLSRVKNDNQGSGIKKQETMCEWRKLILGEFNFLISGQFCTLVMNQYFK